MLHVSASLRLLYTRYLIWLRLLRGHQLLSFHSVQVRRFQAPKSPAEVESLPIKSKELQKFDEGEGAFVGGAQRCETAKMLSSSHQSWHWLLLSEQWEPIRVALNPCLEDWSHAVPFLLALIPLSVLRLEVTLADETIVHHTWLSFILHSLCTNTESG